MNLSNELLTLVVIIVALIVSIPMLILGSILWDSIRDAYTLPKYKTHSHRTTGKHNVLLVHDYHQKRSFGGVRRYSYFKKSRTLEITTNAKTYVIPNVYKFDLMMSKQKHIARRKRIPLWGSFI